jgi:hypothetical protein
MSGYSFFRLPSSYSCSIIPYEKELFRDSLALAISSIICSTILSDISYFSWSINFCIFLSIASYAIVEPLS